MIKELKAIVRTECVAELVHALREAGVTRFYVNHVHVLGAGVDPRDYHLSLDEGEAYMEKAKIEIFCRAEEVENVLRLMRERACTGHRGDGIVVVSEVGEVLNIRTGDRDTLALL